MYQDDDPLETEEELRESYPHLYGIEEPPYQPPEYQLSPHHQKILDEERSKLAERRRVVEEHGEDYHNVDELTDEMLPSLNFRRWDNLFGARPANAYLSGPEEIKRSKRRLFSNYWLEGELAILFGDTGNGKSALAMQIARSLAGGERFDPFEMEVEPTRVAYFDFELNAEQFRKRYTAEIPDPADTGPLFPDELIRCPPESFSELPPGFDDKFEFLITSIVDLVTLLEAKVIIIDNITWLSTNIESSPTTLRLMKTLVHLKNRHGLSILVLAHSPKRFSRSHISAAHLHGSTMLSNFADSIFAMGTSMRGENIRYLKGVKHRSSAARPISTEVATIRIGKSGRFLGFTFDGFKDERAHIGWSLRESTLDRHALIEHVDALSQRKFSQREIAAELGVSPATVNRSLKLKKGEETPVSL